MQGQVNPVIPEVVLQANAHVAPIKWNTPPSFGNKEDYLAQIIYHLRGRRFGSYDATEATGLLTVEEPEDVMRFTADPTGAGALFALEVVDAATFPAAEATGAVPLLTVEVTSLD